MGSKRQTYDEMIEKHPNLKGVIDKSSWNFIGHSDGRTIDALRSGWLQNLEKNIKNKRYKRHGAITRGYFGFGKNKATIFIGAGPSLNKNIDQLKELHDIDGLKHPDDRDFIFVASNHMLKPLLKKQIIPDFVFLTDASDVVIEQLTKDIPEDARYVTLIAGLYCSPNVLKKWEKQGRDIRFYLSQTPGMPEAYEKLTKNNHEEISIMQGGNVANCCWSLAMKFFHSTVFIALGNDLSYPLKTNLDERRNSYYADQDYTSNIANRRDEARSRFGWLGFNLTHSRIVSLNAEEKYNISLSPVATTGTLWVYKTWIEAQVAANANRDDLSYYYYNCSEGGILGVMHKEGTDYDDIKNWFMLDSVCKRYRTRTLVDAIGEFVTAKGAKIERKTGYFLENNGRIKEEPYYRQGCILRA